MNRNIKSNLAIALGLLAPMLASSKTGGVNSKNLLTKFCSEIEPFFDSRNDHERLVVFTKIFPSNCKVTIEFSLTRFNRVVEPNSIHIDMITTHGENCQRKGYASEVMSHVADVADRLNVMLTLDVGDYGGPDEEKLRDWYWNFDFGPGDITNMKRIPNGSASRSFLQSPKFLQRFQQLNGVSYQDKVSEIVNVYLGFLVQNNFQIPERPNFSTVSKGFTLLNLEGKSVSFDLTIDTNGWVCGSNVNRMIQAIANPTSGLLRVRLCETTSVFGEYQQNQVFKDAFEQQFWSVIAHELYHIIDPKLFNKKTIKDLQKHKAQTGDFRGRNFRSQLPTYAMMFVEDFWKAFDKVETEFGKVVAENKLREFYHDPNKYYDWWMYYMPSATLMYGGLKPGEKGFYYSLQALRTSIEDKGYV